MPEVLEVKFPPGCQTLPAGFWSAVDVWVRKPHVVNKRLCGARVTEDKGGGAGDLGFLDVDLLRSGLIPNEDRPWSFSVRTLIPKVHCCGSIVHKEVILKDVDRHLVSFLPCEEDAAGQIHQKKSNIYQIQLVQKDRGEWFLQLHIARPDEWLCDAVFYPKLAWLSRELLPRLVRWAAETRTSEFPSTLSLLPVEKYSLMYQQLKDKYKEMVKVWPEVTDPEKFVFEDIAIATYLLVLWAEERAETDSASKQSFVDLGCGNGLLVHILTNEGHPGKGIDVRKRKIWDMFGPGTLLEEKAITPGEGFLFPGADWLIGNHSDELTPWIPVIAARSSYSCQYFVLPCCFFDFFGKYQRRQCKKSQYKEYIDFISEVSQASGFHTEEDCLRIPSTKRVCLVGKSRNYQPTDGGEAEDRRARYIQSRRARPGSAGQASTGGGGGCLDNPETGGTGGGGWAVGFQPRDRVETVRNCAALPRDLVDGVVLQVAHALLGLNQDPNVHTASSWNHGGSLSVREVAELLRQETLQQLKKECGGLQTLLKNNHQVFRVEGGRVHIRDWRGTRGAEKKSAADAKRKPLAPGAVKTRPCWFHAHHPQGCPLQTEQCAFAHGPEDLRPSTKPLKKMKTSVS